MLVKEASATNIVLKSAFLHTDIQYIPRNMHMVFALLCFVVVIHWLIFQYPSSLLHWHCGNLTIAPVPAKQPWWIWINTLCEFIMNDFITTPKQSTTKTVCIFFGIYCSFVNPDSSHNIEQHFMPSIVPNYNGKCRVCSPGDNHAKIPILK